MYRYHKRSKHDGSKFLCDQCEYSTINSSNLLRHSFCYKNNAWHLEEKQIKKYFLMPCSIIYKICNNKMNITTDTNVQIMQLTWIRSL